MSGRGIVYANDYWCNVAEATTPAASWQSKQHACPGPSTDLHVVLKGGSLVLGVEVMPLHLVCPVFGQPHGMVQLQGLQRHAGQPHSCGQLNSTSAARLCNAEPNKQRSTLPIFLSHILVTCPV